MINEDEYFTREFSPEEIEAHDRAFEEADTLYSKYRGKCKEFSEALIELDPSLILVRGFYMCPMWGKQQHWWVKDRNGKIIDPTVEQFPTKGYAAQYIEFNGVIECDQCGKEVPEAEACTYGSYGFCSSECNYRFVM